MKIFRLAGGGKHRRRGLSSLFSAFSADMRLSVLGHRHIYHLLTRIISHFAAFGLFLKGQAGPGLWISRPYPGNYRGN
jgi:hypothetical protein